MSRCENDTQMQWRRRDVEVADKCSEATFSLTGEDELECIDAVELFKYLRRLLDRSEDDWPEVLWNIRKARQVWGCLTKMIRREGKEPAVSEKFYCVLIQAVLLSGAETWVLLAPMAQRLEVIHAEFLRQVTKLKVK